MNSNSRLTHLECSKTGKTYDSEVLQNLSAAGAPLLARYDLEAASHTLTKESLKGRQWNMWRYREVLPVRNADRILYLGEGGTPLHCAPRLGKQTGFPNLMIKDESVNPTGSFKARGLSAAINAAFERGATRFAIPSAGNAAGAMSAYVAAGGGESFVFMPADTPSAFVIECRSFGAHVELVDGLISDCGKIVASRKEQEGWFDVSTLKEPYRLEGKKTLGYEIAEQLGFDLPDVILYPTGGGTGLIGMWKAFNEMEQLGWIGSKRPRMVTVQASGCAPMVRAFEEGTEARFWEGAHTSASGLRVPGAVGDFLILKAVRESGGTAIAVTDEAMEKGLVGSDERIVLFNTGSGYKYLEALGSSS
ncbi:MAG: threonine synthase [Rhodothermaceae bacterium]|nr:threonine synthase [Rhodothermaceae bacterium]